MLLGGLYSQCNESNWHEYYPDMQGCDLVGAYLAFADLSWVNLTGADLSYADLSGTYLAYTNLSCANFTNANLWDAYFIETTWDDECGITDSNGDGYDDVSYEAGATSGYLNLDGIDNVLDVVMLMDNILNP